MPNTGGSTASCDVAKQSLLGPRRGARWRGRWPDAEQAPPLTSPVVCRYKLSSSGTSGIGRSFSNFSSSSSSY
jgi:hypothetical protein